MALDRLLPFARPFTRPRPPSAFAQVAGWSTDALCLWRRAPWMLPWVLALGALISAPLLLLPWAGVVLINLLMPMFTVGVLLGLAQLHRGEALRVSTLWASWRQPGWGALWLLAVLVGWPEWLVSVGSAWLAYGEPTAHALLFKAPLPLPLPTGRVLQWMVMLPAMLPSTLLMLMLVLPLRLFRGLGAVDACVTGVRMVLERPAPFALWIALQAGLAAICLSSTWTLVLALPIGVWLTATQFVIWQNLADEAPQPRTALTEADRR